MTDQSIFSQTPSEPPNTPAVGDPVTDPSSSPAPSVTPESIFNDQLAAIKNERGEQKYDSIQKALEGLQHSQSFISQLKSELDAAKQEAEKLKTELGSRESVEDVIARLTASQEPPTTPEATLDEQKVAALFDQLLTQNKVKETSQANVTTVQQELVTKFGSSEAAQKAVADKAKELGTTPEEIGMLSAKSPQLVLQLFGSVQRAPSGSPPKNGINTDGFLRTPTAEEGLKPPEKSLLAGATYKEQKAYLDQVRADVYKRLGVEA